VQHVENFLLHTNTANTQLCVIQHRFNINIIAKIENFINKMSFLQEDIHN
jgi:hypothetical protein